MIDFVTEFYTKVKALKAAEEKYNTVVMREDFADELIEAICGEPPKLTTEFNKAELKRFQLSKLRFILGYVLSLNIVVIDRTVSATAKWTLGY